MLNSKFQHYFNGLDTYLELRDLAKNTVKSYHSYLRAYLTWTSETLAVSPEEVTYENIRSYLLYSSSADTLKELAQDKRHLDAEIGFISILHTWGSNISYHPHIHIIVLGGELSKEEQFLSAKTGFLFPIQAVSKLFRGKFLHGLKMLYDKGHLKTPFSNVMLQYRRAFNDFLSLLYAKEWVPHLKETFNGAENVINYLGRYTHNIAISNSRILKIMSDSVTFSIKDYKIGNPFTVTLALVEFIRRFLMRVLPDRFVRIRHYGLLSNRLKRKK